MNPLHIFMQEEAIKLIKKAKKRFAENCIRPHVLATDSLCSHRDDLSDWMTCIYRKLLASKRLLVELLYQALELTMNDYESMLILVWSLRETMLLVRWEKVEAFLTSREWFTALSPFSVGNS